MEMEEASSFHQKKLKQKFRLLYILGSLLILASSISLYSAWEQQKANKPGGNRVARTYVKAMNRLQQAYYLDHRRFASSLEELDFSINPAEEGAESYVYLTVNFRHAAFNYAVAKQAPYKSWVGGVFIVGKPKTHESYTEAILCVTKSSNNQEIEAPVDSKTCGTSMEKFD
jgi:hypothetical protein